MSDSEESIVVTERSTKSRRAQGIPPENSGLETPRRGKKKTVEAPVADSGAGCADSNKDGDDILHKSDPKDRPTSPSVNTGYKTPAGRSYVSSKSTASAIRTKKLELEMKAIAEIAEAEAEHAKQELKRKKLLIHQRLRFDLSKIEEGENSDDSQNLDGEEDQRDPEDIVERWMRNNNNDDDANYNEPPRNNVQNDDVNSKLEKLLARQSVPKELPTFSGDPKDWQLFISQYNNSTDVCGLTNAENAVRLAKCLQGKAKETVAAMLGVPENVPLVIETLQLTFGRPNKIIKALIEQVQSIPAMREFDADTYITFSNRVQSMVTTMKSLKSVGHLANPQLLEELLAKIPIQNQLQWCMRQKGEDNATVTDFAEFLRSTASAAAMMPISTRELLSCNDSRGPHASKVPRAGPSASGYSGNSHSGGENRPCLKCKKLDHKLQKCPEFLKMNVEDRWKFVRANRCCFSCLLANHSSTNCRSKATCGINNCTQSHHQCLHKPNSNYVGHTAHEDSVLLRMLPVRITGPKGSADVMALLDDGSTLTLIESPLAESIGLEGSSSALCLKWTSNVSNTESDSKIVDFKISAPNDNAKVLTVHHARTVKRLELPSQSVNFQLLSQTYPYLNGIPFNSYFHKQPQILIGEDNILMSSPRGILHGQPGEPVATKTWLGWTVHGSILQPQNSGFVLAHHSCLPAEQDEIDVKQMIKDSFSTEAFGVNVPARTLRSKADERSMAIMQQTTRRIDESGRFETGLLWKSDDLILPESKSMALNRLRCVERKMDSDENYATQYIEKIEDYINKGYAKKLTAEEARKVTNRTWFIPHFAVTNPNKPGKIRIVFDCAAKSHGMSLNDALLTGPDLYNAIPAIIMRFRQGKIAFTSDIAEMFPQIKILPEDQHAQRFLWRGRRRTGEPDVYCMTSMIFGAACSPASAIFCKDLNAEEFADEFPQALGVIKRNMYMDDALGSRDSEEEALQIILDIIEIHKRGGFNIRNWICNSKSILSKIPVELVAKDWSNLDKKSEMPTERVLGMWWDSQTDCFTYKLNFHRVDHSIVSGARAPTKRDVLKITMSIYDPIGLLSHFVIKARILFQMIWRSGIQWDDLISDSLLEVWNSWNAELKQIPTVKVPRWYFPTTDIPKKIQLHTFVDASESAFASVSYLRIVYDDKIHTVIVNGKMRVAPLKPLTIPRLELQGAVLGVRAANSFRAEVEFSVDSMHFWSDSQTVLCWIRSEARRFNQFVGNRIGEILEASDVEEWRWVPTQLNPADLATRGSKPVDLSSSSFWFRGPEFLRKNEEDWPEDIKSTTVPAEDPEVREEDFVLVAAKKTSLPVPDITRLTRMYKLLRSTAYMLRFISICKNRTWNNSLLTLTELAEARKLWIKKAQQDFFANELAILHAKQEIPRSSPLYTLAAFIDADGILRMGGRICRATDATFDTKYPILLPSQHRFVHLLIFELHITVNHQGTETVINTLREKYWVLRTRSTVKKVLRTCQRCRNVKALPVIPEMGLLPSARVTTCSRPFLRTGIDYFGPMTISAGHKHEKRYGLIFTCMAVRAVHIELTSSLSTDSTLMAIRRFAARRGFPLEIWSDNGTGFIGAEKELRELLAQQDQRHLSTELLRHGVTWNNIPPLAPNMGGSWERLIRSVKVALSATLYLQSPKEEFLLTLLAEVEFIINSRPLTHVSVDPKDPVSLTPNHFLLMGDRELPNWDSDDQANIRKQWRRVQQRADIFWRRWVSEYLPTLTRRTGGYKRHPNLQVDDVVVIVDPKLPRYSWPLGRIHKVFPGKDKVVRSAEVRTKNGFHTRPIRLLAKLDVATLDDKET